MSVYNKSDHRVLYNKLAPFLMGICLRYTKSRYDAEDYLQEAFIKIFTKLDQFRGEVPIEAWAKRITINTILEDLRKNKLSNRFIDIDEIHDFNETKTDFVSDLEINDLLNIVGKLPEGKKLIFNLYVIEGFSHKEIAKELNINEGTSKSQLAKAKELLVELHKKANTEYAKFIAS